MQNIQFDDGMKSYQLNQGGLLRFNPADPNIYARFMQLEEKLDQLQQALSTDPDMASQLERADRGVKELLGWVFGRHNDFDALLGGVSLLAVADNGKRVLNNFLEALAPVLEQGAQQCAADLTAEAVQQAQDRRENQC